MRRHGGGAPRPGVDEAYGGGVIAHVSLVHLVADARRRRASRVVDEIRRRDDRLPGRRSVEDGFGVRHFSGGAFGTRVAGNGSRLIGDVDEVVAQRR